MTYFFEPSAEDYVLYCSLFALDHRLIVKMALIRRLCASSARLAELRPPCQRMALRLPAECLTPYLTSYCAFSTTVRSPCVSSLI